MAQRSSTRESKAERDTNGVDWFHLFMFPSTMSFDGSRNETNTLFEGKYLFFGSQWVTFFHIVRTKHIDFTLSMSSLVIGLPPFSTFSLIANSLDQNLPVTYNGDV